MPRIIRTIEQIMGERRRDTYFLRFPLGVFDGRPSSHRVRQEQLGWLEANGLGVEPTAPDGWLEGDAGIYALDCERDDPRILTYASLFEDGEGGSLDPKEYQMYLRMYDGEALTEGCETPPPIPPRWAYLTNDCGEIDGFLLTPTGRESGSDLAPAAVRGGYDGNGEPADAVLAVWRRNEIALVTLNPIQQVFGSELSGDDLATITDFVVRNRTALLDHWAGRSDSFDLIHAIRPPL